MYLFDLFWGYDFINDLKGEMPKITEQIISLLSEEPPAKVVLPNNTRCGMHKKSWNKTHFVLKSEYAMKVPFNNQKSAKELYET